MTRMPLAKSVTDRSHTPSVVVLADDLSGAAEVAGIFLQHTADVSLGLDFIDTSTEVAVVDLDSRGMNPREVEGLLHSVVNPLPANTRIVAKIDSLLRGNVAATVGALAVNRPVIVAGGLPLLNRVIRRGVLLVDGVPLADTDMWNAEVTAPPTSLAELVGAPVVAVDHLDRTSGVVVCDVESDDDLDRIVTAVAARPDIALVGTSALAAAVVRTLPNRAEGQDLAASGNRVLVVVGTASRGAIEQVEQLASDGVRVISVESRDLLDGCADTRLLSTALDAGSVALTVGGPVDPSVSRDITAALAQYVRDGLGSRTVDLALTGGETARAVVAALGMSALRPLGHVHYGAVVSAGSGGRRIVTRPGSFGDRHSLSAIHSYLIGTPPLST